MASCAARLPDLRAAHVPISWPYTSLVSTFAHEGIHCGGVEEIHPRFDHPTFLKLVVTQGGNFVTAASLGRCPRRVQITNASESVATMHGVMSRCSTDWSPSQVRVNANACSAAPSSP